MSAPDHSGLPFCTTPDIDQSEGIKKELVHRGG